MSTPKVAFIGTGGTIASLGAGPLDLQDYGAARNVMHADAILARWPETALVAEVIAVPYRNIPSTAIDFADWQALVTLCDRLVADHPDLAGIVIGHGTATLEETAYMLNLTLKVPLPVVVVGVAAAVQRAVVRCRDEPGQCDPRRRLARGARHGRAGGAERRDPRRARGDQDLYAAAADVPHAGFRGAGPCRWRRGGVLPPAAAPLCAGYRVRHSRADGAAAGGHRLCLCRRRRHCGTSVRGGRRAGHRVGRVCARGSRHLAISRRCRRRSRRAWW